MARAPLRTLPLAPRPSPASTSHLPPAVVLSPPTQFAKLRKAYVPLYASYLRAVGASAWGRHDLASQVDAMDRQLPEPTIRMFRRLAHAEVGGTGRAAGH